jgi:hypothetical protein
MHEEKQSEDDALMTEAQGKQCRDNETKAESS